MNQQERKQAYEVALAKSNEAKAVGDELEAKSWLEVAAHYKGGSASTGGQNIETSGEIEAAPVQNESGYYYYDAAGGRWVPTSREDAMARQAAGEKVMKPGSRGEHGAV